MGLGGIKGVQPAVEGGRGAVNSEQKWGKGEERAVGSGGEIRPPKAPRDRSVPGKG